MADLSYIDFDLTFRPENGGYKIQVDESATGARPSGNFVIPFTAKELLVLRSIVEAPSREIGMPPPDRTPDLGAKLRIFGERLYKAVFIDNVGASLSNCLLMAKQQVGMGVRIRLHLDEVPELWALPWEYLYDESNDSYLALSEVTPIVRHLALDGPAVAVQVRPPLNMLVMISAPKGLSTLDEAEEWKKIQTALDSLIKTKQVSITKVPKANLKSLQECLQKQTYHIFHFIGHGGWDEEKKEPVLALQKEDDGTQDLTPRKKLKVALGSHPSLRVVVLNSCDGARPDSKDPFGGMAQGLVQGGIPAVVAMQFKITNDAAISFASGFYKAIANNLPIDNALAEARKDMFFSNVETEWGTPVLFMRGKDGRFFLIDRPTEEQQRMLQIKALTEDAHAAIDAKRYADAIAKLNEIVALQ